VIVGVTCSGYVMVVGMAVPMSSKARRCRGVGVARMSMVVPAMRVVLRVRVARWSRTPVKERTGRPWSSARVEAFAVADAERRAGGQDWVGSGRGGSRRWYTFGDPVGRVAAGARRAWSSMLRRLAKARVRGVLDTPIQRW